MTDEALCVWQLWDDDCGEVESAEIHHEPKRWNYHAYLSREIAERRIRQANAFRDSRP